MHQGMMHYLILLRERYLIRIKESMNSIITGLHLTMINCIKVIYTFLLTLIPLMLLMLMVMILRSLPHIDMNRDNRYGINNKSKKLQIQQRYGNEIE
nr:MAG TPA: hypothetical protein [Bacteriophage sp.]